VSKIFTPNINHAVYVQVYGFMGNNYQPGWNTVQSLFEREDRSWDDLVIIARGRAVEYREFHKQVRVVEYTRNISATEVEIF
jgi:hypothetical protein